MSEINKSNKRQSSANGPYYSAQFGNTFNNKVRALAKKLAELTAAFKRAMEKGQSKKADNIQEQIKLVEAARKSIPLKRGG
jgi:Sec-independent protein translocase protein TatA